MNPTLEALTNLMRSSTEMKLRIPMFLFRSDGDRGREVREALDILDSDDSLFVTKMDHIESESVMVVVEVMQ